MALEKPIILIIQDLNKRVQIGGVLMDLSKGFMINRGLLMS